MQLGCTYVTGNHEVIPIATCVGLESSVKNQSLHAGLESPAGVGKPCQKSEFTCRVGKPSSNLYLQNPRGGGASLHPTEATMEEVHWKHRNSTTSCGQEPCAAYICVFSVCFLGYGSYAFQPRQWAPPPGFGKGPGPLAREPAEDPEGAQI